MKVKYLDWNNMVIMNQNKGYQWRHQHI